MVELHVGEGPGGAWTTTDVTSTLPPPAAVPVGTRYSEASRTGRPSESVKRSCSGRTQSCTTVRAGPAGTRTANADHRSRWTAFPPEEPSTPVTRRICATSTIALPSSICSTRTLTVFPSSAVVVRDGGCAGHPTLRALRQPPRSFEREVVHRSRIPRLVHGYSRELRTGRSFGPVLLRVLRPWGS